MSSNQPNVPPWFWGQPTQPPPGSTGVAGNQTYPGQQAQDTLTTFWNWVWQHPGQNFQQTQAGAGRGNFPPASPFSSDRSTSYRGYSPNAGMDNESARQSNTFPPQGGVVPQNVGAGGMTTQSPAGVVPQNVGAGGATPPAATAGVTANQLSTRGSAGQGVITATGGVGGQGNGTGTPNGMSPDELKWKGMADKVGLNWDVVKNVYMNPARQGSPNPAYALGRALKDKAWGDAALAAGILRQGGSPENDAWNNQVWIDHFNAGDNQQYDPMAGHNDAWANYQANYQNYSNLIEPPAQPPDWYQAPPP